MDVPLFEVAERHLALVADTETPAGIVVVASTPAPPALLPRPEGPALGAVVLDQVRDPGNIGGILRTAAAAGIRHVISTEGSADLWAPKVVRAGAGAHFRLFVYAGRRIEEVVEWLAEWDQCVLADGRSRTTIYQVDWSVATVLVLSNEARGASSWLDDVPTVRAAIPMYAETESMNVGAAAAVLFYEARRPFLGGTGA